MTRIAAVKEGYSFETNKINGVYHVHAAEEAKETVLGEQKESE